MTEAEKRQKRVCFTGHRPQKLHGLSEERIKAMLRTGREYLLEVLSDVNQMSILYHLPNDDERLWEEAARKLGI